jgi:tetratricopeptide (TPR) repeat protein
VAEIGRRWLDAAWLRGGAVALALCAVGGCAAKAPVMPPAPVTPRHPEFRYPTVPPAADAAQASRIERGWRYLQSDNLRGAQREFESALQAQPSFHPAQTGMGYIDLARNEADQAVVSFDRALATETAYVPALVGRGQALLELKRDGEALSSFEAALKADSSLTDLRGRIDVLRFRAVQDNLTRAKAASDAGRWSEAKAAYTQAIMASPDSAFLYRDLALVERKAGEQAPALEHLQKAVSLDASDARSHAQIGEILEDQGDAEGALAAYTRARSLDPAEVAPARLNRLKEALALARLPAEYRAIPSAAAATRGDVAALLGVRLESVLARTPPRQAVVTDLRGHWAERWILAAVRAGVMDTQPNYTFQPGARVRRGDLAQTVSRVLGLVAANRPDPAKAWLSARMKVADVPPAHLSYPAVSQAVASGVMSLDEKGAFQLLRPVTGAEVVEAVTRLEALAKP